MDERIINVLNFYGAFLILCGIASIIFIGMKAKTALMSGGMSGALVILVGYLVRINFPAAHWAALILPFALFGVFSWRSTKTLHKIFELITSSREDVKAKGTAFLIISLMAVMSLVVLMVQLVG